MSQIGWNKYWKYDISFIWMIKFQIIWRGFGLFRCHDLFYILSHVRWSYFFICRFSQFPRHGLCSFIRWSSGATGKYVFHRRVFYSYIIFVWTSIWTYAFCTFYPSFVIFTLRLYPCGLQLLHWLQDYLTVAVFISS